MKNTDIKNLRHQTGLTQAAFAKKYGIPLSTLQHWEQGHRIPPDYVVNLISKEIDHNIEIECVIDYLSDYMDSPSLYGNPDNVLNKMWDKERDKYIKEVKDWRATHEPKQR